MLIVLARKDAGLSPVLLVPIHRRQFGPRVAAQAAIFERIEVFYSRERFHSALARQSPVDFETQLN